MAAAAVAQPQLPEMPEVELAPARAGYASGGQPAEAPVASTRPGGKEICAAFNDFFLTPEFWEKHWEQYPYHFCAASAGQAANLLPEALCAHDIADLVRRSGSSLKMFRKGDPCEEENFLVGYLDGASMIVNQAERYCPSVYEFCRILAALHFHHVFAVVYLTPPNSFAVRIHNDDQDVFLLQVWGRKHWTIRDAPQLGPYTEEMLGKDEPVPPELISEPIMSFDMAAGDILYIPRGFLHEARTSDQPSLHITVTMPTSDYCWGVQLVKHLMQDIHARDVPPEVVKARNTRLEADSGAEDEAINTNIEDIFNHWESKISVDGVLEAFEQRMGRVNEGQERAHNQAMSLKPPRPQVTEDRRVRLMYGVSCWCEADGEVAVFKRDTQRMELPIAPTAASLIRSLTARPQKVSDLPCVDTFERICVLQLLLDLDVVQLFTRGADERTLL